MSDKHRKQARALVEKMLAEMPQPEEQEVDLGWSFSTGGGDMLEGNLHALFYRGPEDNEAAAWVTKGWVTPDGEFTRAGIDALNEGLLRAEQNFVRWLGKQFNSARSEGHSDDDLVGTLWVDTRDRNQLRQLGQFTDADARGDEYELIDREFYEPEIYKGVNDLAARLMDVTVTYFNVPEWLAEMINAD